MIENHRRGWRTCRSTGLIGILVLGVLASSALGAGPALKRLDPPGAQRGTAFTLTLVGRHLEGAEIVSDLPGTFTPLTASGQGAAAGKAEEKRPFLVELPGETPVGLYTLRLRSPEGLSNALLFSVGALPEVSEEEVTPTGSPGLEQFRGREPGATASRHGQRNARGTRPGCLPLREAEKGNAW